MGLPKKKDKSGEEFYKGKLREAQKQIRELQKSLRQLNRAKHTYEDILLEDNEEVEAPVQKPRSHTCPECGKGKLSTSDFLGRVFETCDTCDYRRKISG